MPSRFNTPRPQFLDDEGLPRAGYKLFFFLTGTNTKANTYSNMALSVANTNPIVLDEYGQPAASIFLQDIRYRVVLAEPDANDTLPTGADIVWDDANVSGTDFGILSIRKVGSGNPNGSVAGTAGSAGVMPTEYWDFTNNILYICTTTGSTTTAVWTAINVSAAAAASVPPPMGRLTLTTGAAVPTGNVSAATVVYYTPVMGSLVPIYNGTAFAATTFAELSLTMNAAHTANGIYDVFVFLNSGVATLCTGPVWTTLTAGAGARGAGAGTTALTRLGGLYVNAVSMTGRNGATTYSIAANRATYLGSIWIDASNGQVSCLMTYGQSGKWGVWNAYNRMPVICKVGDATATHNYSTATIRAWNNDATNKFTAFFGLAESQIKLDFANYITQASADAKVAVGIGLNSTTAITGFYGTFNPESGRAASPYAKLIDTPKLGINAYQMLQYPVSGAGTTSWLGGEDDCLMTAEFMA